MSHSLNRNLPAASNRAMKLHLICSLPLFACLVFSAKGQEEPAPELRVIKPEKELLILDPAVVDSPLADYPGPLSIGHLFDQMAADGDGATMMRRWLETWTRDLNINGAEVPARPGMVEKVIAPWQRADGFDPDGGEEWRPDLANAPFRLLAVVNRMDLVSLAPVYYGGMLVNAKAEGRLVYAVIDQQGRPLDHHFTVIFEYHMPEEGEVVAKLAKGWHELGGMPEFDQCYLDKLSSLTRAFTDRVRDKENGGWLPPTIAQVRTNDMALDEACEMREFRLSEKRNVLAPATLANTPSMAFARKGSRLNRVLANFIAANSEAAKDGSLELPEYLRDPSGEAVPVLAGSSTVPSKRFHWDSMRITDPETRHNFSMRTCNGCHSGDTNTEFCHISPRLKGQASEVSDFLRMDGRTMRISDPAQRRRTVKSNEMQDRIAAYLRVLQPELSERDLEKELRKVRRSH